MNIKINILRSILIILLIGVFFIIFRFSNQDGEKSGKISREITETVTQNVKSIQKLEKTEKKKVLDKIEHYIRKLAHFSIYTLVGILTMSLMSTYELIYVKKIGISFFIGVIYAISDEIHQAFIFDRTAAVTDVFIDSGGVIFGILIVIGIIYLYKYFKDLFYKKVTN